LPDIESLVVILTWVTKSSIVHEKFTIKPKEKQLLYA